MRNVFASLTSRLVLVTVALVAVVTILVAGATTLVLQNYLQDQLDTKVQDSFRRAAAYRAPLSPAPVPPGSAEDPNGPDVDDARGQGVGTVTAEWYSGYHPSGNLLVTRTNGKGGLLPLTDDQLTALQQVPADGEPHTVKLPGLG